MFAYTFTMSISVDKAIEEGNKEINRRDSEVFIEDGKTERLILARNPDGNFKNLKVVTRGGYPMYGVPVVVGEDEKHFFIFVADAPQFFSVAKENGGVVVAARSGKKTTYSS